MKIILNVFYARGVLETVKKLRWCPDVIYCQGWISSVVPFYIKTAYRDEPPFAQTKVISSLYGEMPDATLATRFAECLEFRDANEQAVKDAGVDLTQKDSLGRLAVAFSDGVIEGEVGAQPALIDYAKELNVPVLTAPADDDHRPESEQSVHQFTDQETSGRRNIPNVGSGFQLHWNDDRISCGPRYRGCLYERLPQF